MKLEFQMVGYDAAGTARVLAAISPIVEKLAQGWMYESYAVSYDHESMAQLAKVRGRPRRSTLRRFSLELMGADDMPNWQDGLAEFAAELRQTGEV